MQSPLTPQRGRIESNPREYTHMERPACNELAVMPLGSRCILAVRRTNVEIRTDERGYPDTCRMRVENRTKLAPKAQKPSNNPLSFSSRPKIHAHPLSTHLSSLTRL